jgi:hypothetical protein
MTDSTGIGIVLIFILPVVILIAVGVVGTRRRARTRKFYSLCRAIGSASELTGEVCYAVVFLHRHGIDSNRMQVARKSFEKAREFLVEHAWRYRKNLTFKPLFQLPFKMRTRTSALDDRKIKRLGQRFGRLFKPGPGLGHRSYFVLVFTSLLPEDQGKAVVGIDADQPPCHPEYCLCSTEASPALIAHEILHLFGARDLEQGDASVMHRVDQPIEELSVDDNTAYSVGWHDRLDGR